MANAEHLDILDAGLQAWNKWRTREPNEVSAAARARALAGAVLGDAALLGLAAQGGPLGDDDVTSIAFANADVTWSGWS